MEYWTVEVFWKDDGVIDKTNRFYTEQGAVIFYEKRLTALRVKTVLG